VNAQGRSTLVRQLLWHALVMGAAGVIAYQLAGFPRWVHATLFAIVATAGTVLLAISAWVSSRFDSILADAAKLEDAVRVRGIFHYVAGARRELVVFLWIDALSWLAASGMSFVIFKYDHLTSQQFGWIAAIGYAGAAAVGMYAVRVSRAYLRLDSFRHELFEALAEEKRRVARMRSLAPSVLTPMTPISGKLGGSRSGRRKKSG
jgi:hypothetical protein